MSNDIDFQGKDDGDLRDPALRRALDHAPDRDATPHPRTRDAILKMAHNLANTPASAPASAANNASAAPWWRRLFGGGDTRARMPWNAAFATVLVAGFVTVLWHREPIPDARLDGEAKVASAPAPAPAAAPTPPVAESAPSPAIVAQQAPAAEAPAAPVRDAVREAPDRATLDAARKPAPATARKQVEATATPAPEAKEAPAEPVPTPAPAEAQSAAVPVPPPPATAAPVPPPALAAAAPGVADSSARVRQKSESAQDEREQERRSSAYAAAPPAPSVAPAPVAVPESAPPAVVAAAPPAPVAPAPLQRELPANASGSVARGGSPNADVSGAVRDTAPPRAAAAKAARSPTGASSFSALDRWTSFDFMRAGLGVRHARGDIEGMAALVNTVARSATTAEAQLAAPVEARLSLYQGGTLIAMLEIAGDQVRWTPQPGGTATVGTPPSQTLAALRALLTR
ncbi:hypothetical protein [Variovorax sp. RKNM96]|uniref:hypothetical protein n=1 Tax=Variovorax sp. RKNM96 TaxID=2681552 RepID=UPI001F1238E9|nr:hypothetical protein [Variovorax sp. RKNM96]